MDEMVNNVTFLDVRVKSGTNIFRDVFSEKAYKPAVENAILKNQVEFLKVDGIFSHGCPQYT